MERRNHFLVYLTALIPGVGYLYLGLKRKGLQALLLWVLINPIFSLLGLEFLNVLKVVLWFYTFFDTVNLATRMDKGEFIPDSDFLFLGKIFHSNGSGTQGDFNPNIKIDNQSLAYLAGWGLVVLGGLSVFNRLFRGNQIYNLIKHNVNIYFFPVLLVLIGVYLLIKNNNKK